MARSRIKVLLYTVSLGGVRRHIEDIVAQIDPDRYELVGAFPDRHLDRTYLTDEDEGYQATFARAGLETHVVETPVGLSPWPCAAAVWRMAGLLRRIRPDVLHCHSSMAGAVGRLAALAWRPPLVVYTPHLIYFLRLAGLKRFVFASMEKALLPLCDRLIAVSASEYDEIVKVLGHSPRIVRINHSIPRDLVANPVPPVTDAAPDYAREMGLVPGNRIILSTARFDSQKDVATLIRAAGILGRKRSDFTVLLAGDGEERVRLERLAEESGAAGLVRFLGWRNDVRRLVAGSDVMVLSSRKEGLPYALLEAMSLKIPVVGSDVMGVRDCVLQDDTGLLFPCGDAVALARDLDRLLDDPDLCRNMGERGREYALQEFSTHGMITALQDIYDLARSAAKGRASRQGRHSEA